MMKTRFLLILTLTLTLLAAPALAQESSRKNLADLGFRQQMIMLGLYIYGIDQAVSKPIPDHDHVTFLAASIDDIIKEVKKTQRGKLFHKNLDDVLAKTAALKQVPLNNPSGLKQKAGELIDQCAKCHRADDVIRYKSGDQVVFNSP